MAAMVAVPVVAAAHSTEPRRRCRQRRRVLRLKSRVLLIGGGCRKLKQGKTTDESRPAAGIRQRQLYLRSSLSNRSHHRKISFVPIQLTVACRSKLSPLLLCARPQFFEKSASSSERSKAGDSAKAEESFQQENQDIG